MSFGDPWFYIVLLGFAALVYAMMLPARKNAGERTPGGNAELEATLEATLEQYMAEIEKENEELIELVTKMKQELTSKQLAHQEQIAELRQRLIEVEHTARDTVSRLDQQLEQNTQRKTGDSTEDTVSVVPATSSDKPLSPVAEAPYNEGSGALQVHETTEAEPAEQETDEDTVRNRYPELFELYANGKSIDTIAKTTGLQRGEVQLILQLAKREESR